MPGLPSRVVGELAPDSIFTTMRAARPTVIVVGQSQQPRLPASGWFDRGFSAASGVFTAYLLFFVLPPVLICAGVAGLAFLPGMFPPQAMTPQPAAQDAPASLGTKAAAKGHALTFLRKHGVDYLSDNCIATWRDGAWHIEGTAIKDGGAKVDIEVVQRVTQDGNTLRWTMTDAVLGTRVLVKNH